MTQIKTHAAANPRPNETQSMDAVSWVNSSGILSIQNTHASHPDWDERRCLPWFHPLDGLPTLGCRPTFIINRHSCAVTGIPGAGYSTHGRSPARSRVVFTGGWQRRLSVYGLPFLLLTCLVTRPGHRVGFIIPHFALCANHSSFSAAYPFASTLAASFPGWRAPSSRPQPSLPRGSRWENARAA